MGAEDKAVSAVCMLPFPERYHAAAKFVALKPSGAKPMGHDAQLLIYALGQQVAEGPCTATKPWGWNVVESAKHTAWKQLGNMPAMEAMRLYVRTVEEEQSDWYALLLKEEANPSKPPAAAVTAASGTTGSTGGAAAAVQPAITYARELQWTQLPAVGAGAEGRRPVPRYEQGAGLVGSGLYVVGGNYAGRYLSDVWRLDTHSLTWSQLSPVPASLYGDKDKVSDAGSSAGRSTSTSPRVTFADGAKGAAHAPEQAAAAGAQQAHAGEGVQAAVAGAVAPPLGPSAGHSVTVWGSKLVILGGHVKGKGGVGAMPVRVYDTSANAVWHPHTSGTAPSARGGHSAVLLGGSKLYVFGGEDAGRRALGDLYCLDLEAMSWSGPLAPEGTAPAPRAAHAAGAYLGRYMLLFGGGSIATCYGDVHILDTQAKGAEGGLRWIVPSMQGPKVSPRAGHCSAVVGDAWYVVGGGNNVKGCTDLLALDLRGLAAVAALQSDPESGASLTKPPAPVLMWHALASTPPRDPLSSEGISLLVLQHPLPAATAATAGSHSAPAATAGHGSSANGSSASAASGATAGKGGVLLAFGGYNGKYTNAVSVLRVPPSLAAAPEAPVVHKTPAASAQAKPAAAQDGKKNSAGGAAAAAAAGKEKEKEAMAAAGDAKDRQIAELKAALEAARNDAEAAISQVAAAKDGSAAELALLRKQLATSAAQLETAHKGLEDARAALGRESAKVLRLEAQVAELHKALGAAAEERKELEALRRQVSEAEAKKASSGGLWGYISGGGQ